MFFSGTALAAEDHLPTTLVSLVLMQAEGEVSRRDITRRRVLVRPGNREDGKERPPLRAGPNELNWL